jgi:hypothetical protein
MPKCRNWDNRRPARRDCAGSATFGPTSAFAVHSHYTFADADDGRRLDKPDVVAKKGPAHSGPGPLASAFAHCCLAPLVRSSLSAAQGVLSGESTRVPMLLASGSITHPIPMPAAAQ